MGFEHYKKIIVIIVLGILHHPPPQDASYILVCLPLCPRRQTISPRFPGSCLLIEFSQGMGPAGDQKAGGERDWNISSLLLPCFSTPSLARIASLYDHRSWPVAPCPWSQLSLQSSDTVSSPYALSTWQWPLVIASGLWHLLLVPLTFPQSSPFTGIWMVWAEFCFLLAFSFILS